LLEGVWETRRLFDINLSFRITIHKIRDIKPYEDQLIAARDAKVAIFNIKGCLKAAVIFFLTRKLFEPLRSCPWLHLITELEKAITGTIEVIGDELVFKEIALLSSSLGVLKTCSRAFSKFSA